MNECHSISVMTANREGGSAGFVGAADGLACFDRAADGSASFVLAADGLVPVLPMDRRALIVLPMESSMAKASSTTVICSLIQSLSSKKSQVLWDSHNTLAKITGLFSMKVYLIVTVIAEMRARKNTLLRSIE